MASCDLGDRCFFFNEPLFDNLLSNAERLREKYCAEDFAACAIYKLAKAYSIGKVRGYVCPDDVLEEPGTTPANVNELNTAHESLMKVIFADGSEGMVRASRIGRLIRASKIAAYRPAEEWVEVRRKRINNNYSGPERRRTVHLF